MLTRSLFAFAFFFRRRILCCFFFSCRRLIRWRRLFGRLLENFPYYLCNFHIFGYFEYNSIHLVRLRFLLLLLLHHAVTRGWSCCWRFFLLLGCRFYSTSWKISKFKLNLLERLFTLRALVVQRHRGGFHSVGHLRWLCFAVLLHVVAVETKQRDEIGPEGRIVVAQVDTLQKSVVLKVALRKIIIPFST